MSTKPKHTNGAKQLTSQPGPSLHFEFIERISSDPFTIDVRVLGMLDHYTHYIESLAGKRPSKDEVVEKALHKVLFEDAGFQKYLSAANGKVSATRTQVAQPEAEPKPEPNQAPKVNRHIPISEKANEVLRT